MLKLVFTFPIFLVLSQARLSAQYAYTYYNVYASGNTIYATATIDGGMNGVPYGITHTYTPTVSISNPSGRGASGRNTQTVPAGSSSQITASAQLNFDTADVGTGTVSITFSGTCSEVGPFLYQTAFVNPVFSIDVTNYKYTGGSCGYKASCAANTANVCSKQYPTLIVQPDKILGCQAFYVDESPVVTIFGVPECAPVGIGTMSTTPTACSGK